MIRLNPRAAVISLISVLTLAGASAACEDDKDSPSTAATGDAAAGISCARDSRVKPFATGMEAKSTSGKLVAQILDASPSPPQRGGGDAGVNEWTLKLTSDGQAPDAKAVTVSTLMPDHGHGSPRVPVLTANGDGTYALSDIFLFMAGVWEISLQTSPQETATFTICVD